MIPHNFRVMRPDSYESAFSMERFYEFLLALKRDPGASCCSCAEPLQGINTTIVFWDSDHFLVGGLCTECAAQPDEEIRLEASKYWDEAEVEVEEIAL